MRASLILRAAQHRTPSIKFIGKRTPPNSFATYRSKAQQHGPLGGNAKASTSGFTTYGAIGGSAGRSLGSVQPKEGEVFDRNDLPKRFWRTQWTDEEIDAVTSGGATLVA
ncbi:hypothetical protein LTR84_001726 [Exophiala bonariae]|uniref:Uncharacterized protein n=1 Tax=Exophiala bonariae TaxID=1690606 RepID=A0AAV9NCA2_9EURO|nr:hypothetical protein LTR84_001726 [Exophiala bonariae]